MVISADILTDHLRLFYWFLLEFANNNNRFTDSCAQNEEKARIMMVPGPEFMLFFQIILSYKILIGLYFQRDLCALDSVSDSVL